MFSPGEDADLRSCNLPEVKMNKAINKVALDAAFSMSGDTIKTGMKSIDLSNRTRLRKRFR